MYTSLDRVRRKFLTISRSVEDLAAECKALGETINEVMSKADEES
jgi:hypothetical protein